MWSKQDLADRAQSIDCLFILVFEHILLPWEWSFWLRTVSNHVK